MIHTQVDNVGTLPTDLLFIGDKPTKTDIFVCKSVSGERLKLLKYIIKAIENNLKRHEIDIKNVNFYYTNIVNSNNEFTAKNAMINQKNLLKIIESSSTNIIIFVGKDTDKYSKNIHNKKSYKMSSLQNIIDNNGTASPFIGNIIQTITNMLIENKLLHNNKKDF
jgi:hypothetical protein